MVLQVQGPRVLLRRMREVMARPEAAQARLDKIVSLIAANMVAEVCSIYVIRPGSNDLELFASEGLKAGAVHKSALLAGEGLVGFIAHQAEPLSLSDAQAHPAFKYLPETGEEIYSSFLGVPIMRHGVVSGVLVVQNRVKRTYAEEEEEALQTVAMVLAEVIATPDVQSELEAAGNGAELTGSYHITGEGLVDGVALGHVVLHEPRVIVTRFIAEDIEEERGRLDVAIDQLQAQVDQLADRRPGQFSSDFEDVLETVRMFARDRGWLRKLREAVATGLTAEAAVERVQSDTRARMARQSDPYLRERLHDLDDIANRLLRLLTGAEEKASRTELPKDSIVVARTMGPAELLDYDPSRLRGLVLEVAGTTSHVAIVARALGVTTVGSARSVSDLAEDGQEIIIDGGSGDVHVRPSQDVQQVYTEKVRLYAKRQAQYAKMRDIPAVTLDGRHIDLSINAGLMVDLPHLEAAGAQGIGLFRTELQFMLARRFPRFGEQKRFYESILQGAGDRPVVFRTLDIGSDKVLPYLTSVKEENPAIGWRAIRMSLDRPALLRLQLRALISAAAGKVLRVMFPMISETSEMVRARGLVDLECRFLEDRGYELPREIKIGAMIEVPALVWQLDQLLPHTDFVSIGSNDLIQFMFAADRQHPKLAGRYDVLSPAALKVMDTIRESCERHSTALTLCGEMAGSSLEAMALIALGFRSISMAPTSIGPVKQMLLKLDSVKAGAFLRDHFESEASSLREPLVGFARQHKIPL
ncbi:MAG: phosphoenolpyruvate--protein phosphotransferase [Anderseniella sp.]|nr:phosphoenolpyruvate--protein phosphotransferase [Anderseniella sp.]